MPFEAVIIDTKPFLGGTVTGTAAISATGVVTVTGVGTATTKPFQLENMCQVEFSLMIQVTGTTGTSAATWTIEASNDYDGINGSPAGTWQDVTADLSTTVTKPFAVSAAATAGANLSTRFESWTAPFRAIRFNYISTVSTSTVNAQFIAKGF